MFPTHFHKISKNRLYFQIRKRVACLHIYQNLNVLDFRIQYVLENVLNQNKIDSTHIQTHILQRGAALSLLLKS